jgi:signal transduction histidine kinase
LNRILLLLDNKTNRALLSDWLRQHYEVVIPDNGTSLVVPFDLCLIDGPTLDRLWQEVRLRKAEDAPIFLPVVLITSQQEAELLTRHLWKTVDELIRVPIVKLELQARVEILLRTRQLSQELKLRNEELESFFHAMTHDVRAPLRAIKGFAQLLKEEEADLLGCKDGTTWSVFSPPPRRCRRSSMGWSISRVSSALNGSCNPSRSISWSSSACNTLSRRWSSARQWWLSMGNCHWCRETLCCFCWR